MPRFLVNGLSALVLLGVSACVDHHPGLLPGPQFSTTPPPGATAAAKPAAPAAQTPAAAIIPQTAVTVRIALLLPLSGDSTALGQSMLDAATLALHDAYVQLKPGQIKAQVVLIPKDTGETPSAAARAAEEAVGQGARLIIGPLYGASVGAAAPVAHKSDVPMIALSNNKAVAGDGVYVFGFLPEQQIQRVADYAAQANVPSLGALLPNSPYGDMAAALLKSTVTSRGIRVEPVEMYGSVGANLDAAAERLKQGYDKTPFQGLFIAEGGDTLKEAITAVVGHGLDLKKIRLIGTGLWDDESVRAMPEMQGAWFASSPPHYYAEFERHFVAAYSYKPQRLASLTYDAVTLAAQLVLASGGADFSAATLTNPQGFVGPGNGLYRLKADGTNERALAVLEIGPKGLKILNGAPTSFEGQAAPVSAH